MRIEYWRSTPSFLSLNDKERKLRLEGVDALVTNVPDVCVAVSTADCVPCLVICAGS